MPERPECPDDHDVTRPVPNRADRRRGSRGPVVTRAPWATSFRRKSDGGRDTERRG